MHLGCGPNLYDEWVNVDGDYCAGQPGVTIHNIVDPYPIPDNSVDEILTVHVIEHIPPGEVPAMIQEWRRILKPMGFVTTEWPDFLKMCQEVAKNPDCLNFDADRRLQKRTILGIFGDNLRYPDPVMWHKWGYSANSLSKLFQSVGYSHT